MSKANLTPELIDAGPRVAHRPWQKGLRLEHQRLYSRGELWRGADSLECHQETRIRLVEASTTGTSILWDVLLLGMCF